jgi:5-methylcytosine-specific restriction endonuclease McrA
LADLGVVQAERRFERGRQLISGGQLRFLRRTQRWYEAHKRCAFRAGIRLDYALGDLRRRVTRQLQGPGCGYCRATLTTATFALDHKVPPRRGGRHALGNLVLCCRTCYRLKGLLDWQEFRDLLQLTQTWPSPVRQNFLARLSAGSLPRRRGATHVPTTPPDDPRAA